VVLIAAQAPTEAALIQLKGAPLSGGRMDGSVTVPLERAAGGDTPVLSFVGGRGSVRLLLDTGASSSMVTPELAARLGIESVPLPPEAFAVAGGGSGCATLRPRRGRLPPLELGSGTSSRPGVGRLLLRNAEVLVMPVGALPVGVDGVLGAPSLRLLPIRIDPGLGTVSLGAPALTASSEGTARPPLLLPLRWRNGVPLVKLDTEAGPVEALADTGAEGLFLTAALASRLPPLAPPTPLRLVGFCGEQTVRRQPFAGVTFPGELRPLGATVGAAGVVEGIVTENPVFSRLGVEAIVGQELLRRRLQIWRLDRQPPQLELR
jgi:hypothetical protein